MPSEYEPPLPEYKHPKKVLMNVQKPRAYIRDFTVYIKNKIKEFPIILLVLVLFPIANFGRFFKTSQIGSFAKFVLSNERYNVVLAISISLKVIYMCPN